MKSSNAGGSARENLVHEIFKNSPELPVIFLSNETVDRVRWPKGQQFRAFLPALPIERAVRFTEGEVAREMETNRC